MTKEEIEKEVQKTREIRKDVLSEFYYPADLSNQDFKGVINELQLALIHAKSAYEKQKQYWNEKH